MKRLVPVLTGLWFGALLASGCTAVPSVDGFKYACDLKKPCGEGFECQAGVCVKTGTGGDTGDTESADGDAAESTTEVVDSTEPTDGDVTTEPPDEGETVADGEGVTTEASETSETSETTEDTEVTGAPTVTLTAVPEALTNQATFAFEFTATGVTTCALDLEAAVPCTSPYEVTPGDGTHTLTVTATANAASATDSATWTVDTVPPETTIVSGPASVSSGSASFRLGASEPGATFACGLDGAVLAPCAEIASYDTLANGAHTFRAVATDAAGNADPSAVEFAWTVDASVFDVTLTQAPGARSGPDVTFAFTASRASSTFKCALDIATPTNRALYAPCTTPKTYNDLADGSHSFHVFAEDPSNNQSQIASTTWTVESVGPTTTITAPHAGDVTGAATLAQFNSDPDATFECKLDAGDYEPCDPPVALTGLASGSHTFSVIATNGLGNVGPVASVTWSVNLVGPSVTLTGSVVEGASTSVRTASFSFSGAGAVSYECAQDGGLFLACTSPTGVGPSLVEGAHSFAVRGVDALANRGAVQTIHWTVDLTAPVVVIAPNSKPANPTGNKALAITFTVSDGDVVCKLDNAAVPCTDQTIQATNLADGTHNVSVTATDHAGNVGTDSYTWVIDTALPTVAITTGPAARTNLTTATFAFTASTSNTTCSLDGAAATACTSPVNVTSLGESPNPHTFTVTVQSQTGSTGHATHNWVVDLTAPVTALLQATPAGSPNNSTSISVPFSANEDATFTCALDGAPAAACASPYLRSDLSCAGAEGTAHTLAVRATDVAGNIEASPRTLTWRCDTTVPTVTLGPASPAAALTNSASLSLPFSANETASFECKLDGEAYVACGASPYARSAFDCSARDGTSHTISVRATDLAGNQGVATYTWSCDTTSPVVTLGAATPSASPTTATTMSVPFSANETATFECKLDTDAFAACTASPYVRNGLSCTGQVGQSHTITVRATDSAGNQGSSTYTWTCDGSAPVLTLGAATPATTPTNATAISIPFSTNEVATTQCRLDNEAFAACAASPYARSNLSCGGQTGTSHTATILATDGAGNAATQTYTWTCDTSAPVVTLGNASPPGSPNASNSISVPFSANETSTFQCKLDGNAYGSCVTPYAASNLTCTGQTGTSHTVTVLATDSAGNQGSSAYTWTCDKTGPVVTFGAASPSAAVTNANQISVPFSANETATLECKLDGEAYASCATPFSRTNLACSGQAGTAHALTVRATDGVGNQGTQTYNWTCDVTSPVLSLGNPTPATSPNNSTSISVPYSANEAATFECNLDGGGYSSCPANAYLNTALDCSGQSGKAHTLTIRAVDTATNSASQTYNWTCDTTAPATDITYHPAAIAGPAGSFIFASNEAGSVYQCSLNNAAFAACAPPVSYFGIGLGAAAFKVRAVDAAGNTEVAPPSFSWTVSEDAQRAVPDSKTATCSDGAGATTCPPIGTSAGQDGSYYQSKPTYTTTLDTATDSVTGLVWQRNPPSGTYTEPDAYTYCDSLVLAGQSDWRLPTRAELISIIDAGTFSPGFPSEFGSIPSNSGFWSQTPVAGQANAYWMVTTNYPSLIGDLGTSLTYSPKARCVRGTTLPASNFVLSNSGKTVIDTSTGLTWQGGSMSQGTWLNALATCEASTLDGFTDWRLPNLKELESIIDVTRSGGVALSPLFSDTDSGWYWSSTPNPGSLAGAYAMLSSSGASDLGTVMTFSSRYRCVRYRSMPDNSTAMCSNGSTAVACPPPNGYAGQDGSYTLNAPNYTVTTETTTDWVTGLTWQRNVPVTTRSQTDAVAYCDGLTLEGYDDWRLPSRIELVTMFDGGTANPALPTVFGTVPANAWEWSSTPSSGNTGYYWAQFVNIATMEWAKLGTDKYLARCVRGIPFAKNTYLLTSSAKSAVDSLTGLTWLAKELASSDWQTALATCEALTTDGFTDWRLPTVKELNMLVDDTRNTPCLDPLFTTYSTTWTSTPRSQFPDRASTLGLGDYGSNGGAALGDPMTGTAKVTCVR